MDLENVRQQVLARVGKHDDEDVAVRVELGESLYVTISSRNPLTYFTQFIRLRSDGTVELPTPDDGFTLDLKSRTVGTAATPAEAVDLVVGEAEQAVDRLREKQARAAERARPSRQPAVSAEDLAEACALWQGGQNGGSSPIRGAARVLTGIPHYFRAEFITGYETAARSQRETLDAGIALLRAVNAAPHLDADGWNVQVGRPLRTFAGRGSGPSRTRTPRSSGSYAPGGSRCRSGASR